MEVLIHTIEKVCVLITVTVVLTGTRFATRLFRRRPAPRDHAIALVLFFLFAAVEEIIAQQHSPMDARIIAACVAGLLAGPWVGGGVGIGSAVLALVWQGFPPVGYGLAMVLGGIAGGLLRGRSAGNALRPGIGFCLAVGASLSRYILAMLFDALWEAGRPPLSLAMELQTALVNGLGVALILTVVAQMRAREEQAKATAMAEVRALQARMNPHFLFNALNTVAALSMTNPKTVAPAVARLGCFLRASLDRPDQTLIPLAEELAVVAAYLDIEGLRLGSRLRVEESIAPEARPVLVPPFLIQPLVENAVCHGIHPARDGGLVSVTAELVGATLRITVSDTGVGFDSAARRGMGMRGSGDASPPHALQLLERRLRNLYGSDASRLWVESSPGQGTTAHVSLPLEPIPDGAPGFP